jgi:hypothetical protein
MLGVADAIDSVGTPPTGEDLQKGLQNFRSRIDAPLERTALVSGNVAGTTSASGSRKRLGRTLKDIEAT